MNPDAQTIPLAHPWQQLRFLRLGHSAVGTRFEKLLRAFGALPIDETTSPSTVAVLIDDRTADSLAATIDPPAWRNTRPNAWVVRFTDFPRGHARWRADNHLCDALIHAELGMDRMASDTPEPEPLALASAYGAMRAAVLLAAGLLGPQGGTIEVSLFAACVTALGRKLQQVMDPRLPDPLSLPHLPLQEIYRCGDGRFVQLFGSFPPYAEAMCVAFGHEQWRAEAARALVRVENQAAVEVWRERIAAEFMQRSAAEAEHAVVSAGGACTVCATREQWLASDHAQACGLARGDAQPVLLKTVADAPVTRNAARGVARAAGSSLPLAGVTVLDFTIVIAGPTCGRMLADLGATVIKIDAPQRNCGGHPWGWLEVNRGKRSVLLDMKTREGLAIVQRLAAQANVVVENFSQGTLTRLGLGFEQARALRPDIVYASLNAFDHEGPWAGRPGWEHNAQAASGMQWAYAKDDEPHAAPLPVNDYGTGLLAVYGVLMGLGHARRTGQAVRVLGSLLRTSSFLQADEFNAVRAGQPLPARQRGTRILRCADGWVVALADVGDVRLPEDDQFFVQQSCAALLAVLDARGVYAARERTLAQLRDDALLKDKGLVLHWPHPQYGEVRQVGADLTPGDVVLRATGPAHLPGEDTRNVLLELGYANDEVERLMAARVVAGAVPLFK